MAQAFSPAEFNLARAALDHVIDAALECQEKLLS
jgi:hypothetical protein